MLKTAVTVWGNRVSPVFDAAGTLLIARIRDRRIVHKQYLAFDPKKTDDLILLLQKMQVDVLVCGAISTKPAARIVENNIKLISFVTGNAQNLLETFARKQNIEKRFMMPGCSQQYGHQTTLNNR